MDLVEMRTKGTDTELLDHLANVGYNNEDITTLRTKGTDTEVIDYLISKPANMPGQPKVTPAIPQATPMVPSVPQNQQINIIPTQEDIAQQRQDTSISLDTQRAENITQAEHEQKMRTDETYAVMQGNKDAGAIEAPLLDPIALPLENKLGEAVIAGIGKVVDRVQWPKAIKDIFQSKDAKSYEEMQNLFEFMGKRDMNPTDALIENSKGSDLRSYLTGGNVFAVKEAFDNQQKLSTQFIKMTDDILGNLANKKIDINNISTWRDIKTAEDIVTQEVNKLRQSYKQIENDMYSKVTSTAKGIKEEYKVNEFTVGLEKQLADEGIPREAVNAVDTILKRFTKPYKDETKQLAINNKAQSKIMLDLKKAKSSIDSAIASGNDKAALKAMEAQTKLRTKLKDLRDETNALKDTRYMTVEDLLNTSKLINRKIYKPGGSISIKDADELRGLQIAKQQVDDFLFTRVKDPALKASLSEARAVTVARAGLFGAKDTGGEKLMLAKLLDRGEYGKVTEYITGKNAKENILYIRDIFGKDSEAYKSSFSLYINDKIGLTPSKLPGILDQTKAIGIEGKVDIQAVAANVSKIDAQDLAMLENINGKQARLDMTSLKQLVTNYADLELAAEKYGKGITGGIRGYLESGEGFTSPFTRGFKVIKDATTFHMAKTAEKIVYNQPKFRALTGAATGEAIYMANTEEDITLEKALAAAIFGGTAGYYGGRMARSLLESDINKVARYLKTNRGAPKDMSADLRSAIERIGNATGGSNPKLPAAPVAPTVPAVSKPLGSFADEYDSLPLPSKEGQ